MSGKKQEDRELQHETIEEPSLTDRLHEFLQSGANEDPESEVTGWLLTRWAVVAEWMDDNGDRYLTRLVPNALPEWDFKMLCREGLEWPAEEEPDDD